MAWDYYHRLGIVLPSADGHLSVVLLGLHFWWAHQSIADLVAVKHSLPSELLMVKGVWGALLGNSLIFFLLLSPFVSSHYVFPARHGDCVQALRPSLERDTYPEVWALDAFCSFLLNLSLWPWPCLSFLPFLLLLSALTSYQIPTPQR